MRIGEKIRILREAQHLTIPELAELVGVNPVTFAQYERGTRAFPYELPDHVAEALGADPQLFRSEEPWAKIERARTRLDLLMAEVQSILDAPKRRLVKQVATPDSMLKDRVALRRLPALAGSFR